MIIKTVFSGFGGQGVLMMGYSFAHGAMSAGYEVTYLPSYGAEVRGGTANCTVSVADEQIASPIASEPDFIVAMNTPSLYSFQNRAMRGGTIFLNSSIVQVRPTRPDLEVYAIPCMEIAEELGSPRAANVVMMGAFLSKFPLVTPEVYLQSLAEIMGSRKADAAAANRKAFEAGYRFIAG